MYTDAFIPILLAREHRSAHISLTPVNRSVPTTVIGFDTMEAVS